jgi:putative transposase
MNKTDNEEPLQPNTVYHIIAHAVENNNLFYNDDNYAYFLRKWQQFGQGYFKTYAFCLMPNHLHLCVQTVDEATLRQLITDKKRKSQLSQPFQPDAGFKPALGLTGLTTDSTINSITVTDAEIRLALSKQINTLLGSYAQALNKQRKRQKALFWGRFERLKVNDRTYFRDLVCYIHHNPIHHFGYAHYCEWGFSSYNLFFQPEEGLFLDKETVFKVFDKAGGFEQYHTLYKLNKQYIIIDQTVQTAFNNLRLSATQIV